MLTNHRRLLQFLALLFPILIAFPVFAENAPSSYKPVTVPNPAADLWRAVNPQQLPPAGSAIFPPGGDSRVQGVQSGVLINQWGERWRYFRMELLLPIGGFLLAAALAGILLFYLIRGKVLIKDGESDKKIDRYSIYERMIHWFLALVFLFLGLSGLILLFGRSLMLPWMGLELFSVFASAAKEGHNLFGPLFLLALALMFLQFVVRNIYQKGDLTWLLKGGGIIGDHDVPSNFFNMGEKSLFWLLIIVGGLIAISGLILLFPLFGQGREIMELSHIVHAITALIMLMVVIGHIYIGTIGMQGALEGMTSGYCDLNWARDHHSWWAQRCIDEGKVVPKHQDAAVQHDNPVPGEAQK